MSLEEYRKNIDFLDDKIIQLLEKRQIYCKSIGEIKNKRNFKYMLLIERKKY